MCKVFITLPHHHHVSVEVYNKYGFRNQSGHALMKFIVAFHLRMPRGEEKFISIGDLQGWGYSNSDIRGYLAALSILQVTNQISRVVPMILDPKTILHLRQEVANNPL